MTAALAGLAVIALAGGVVRRARPHCLRARDRDAEPVTALRFGELGGERPFCVRGPDGKEIAVVRLIAAEPDGGPVMVVVDRYHQE